MSFYIYNYKVFSIKRYISARSQKFIYITNYWIPDELYEFINSFRLLVWIWLCVFDEIQIFMHSNLGNIILT